MRATIRLGPDGDERARLRPAAGADRAASGRAARRVAAARLRPAAREVRHRVFSELPDELGGRARRRQRHARAAGTAADSSGRAAEVLLLEPLGDGVWEALARPTRRLRAGLAVRRRRAARAPRRGALARASPRRAGRRDAAAAVHRRAARRSRRATRRCTRDEAGSAAAPTAGLHFTPELLARLDVERVTLHVGLDTFRPVAVDDLEEHELHGERYEVRPEAWERIRARRARARRRHDDACACSRRSRAARRSPGGRRCSSRRASSSAASTRC